MRRKTVKKLVGVSCIASMLLGSGVFMNNNEAKAEEVTKTITIDGTKVDEHNRFKGFGTVTANNTSRLMLDYKEEHPKEYWEIMNKLFNKDTGAVSQRLIDDLADQVETREVVRTIYILQPVQSC